MEERQIKPFNLIEVDTSNNPRKKGLKLKLSQFEDYLMGNPAEDEFIMFRTEYRHLSSVELQFFQHTNREYHSLGILALYNNYTYRMTDANIYFSLILSENGQHIILDAPPNVDIIHEKNTDPDNKY